MKKVLFTLTVLVFCFSSFAEMTQSSVFVPKELFEKIETEFGIKNFDFNPEFLDVEVAIQSEKGSVQKLKVGYMQEVLDLSSYVDKIWPTFTITFKAPFELEGETSLYFISRYKKMDLGTQQLGLGCGQAVKIKSQIGKIFSSSGMELMTKAGHYLNLLGGDYLLIQKEGQKIKMVYFRIRDGRWSHRLCAT
jgi:hypothetical protein